MTRPGSSVESYRRPSSWLIAGGSFAAYLGLVLALGLSGIRPDVPLPSWAAQAAPPLLYAVLVFLVARPRSALALGGGAMLLWVAHLLVGALTLVMLAVLEGSPAAGAASALPPPLLPELLWVPVLLVPLRDLMRSAPARRSVQPMPGAVRQAAPDRRPATASAAPASSASRPATAPPRPAPPVTSMEPRLDTQRPPAVRLPAAPARTAGEGAPAAAASDKTPKENPDAAAAHAQRLLDELLARETSERPVRVSLDRVLGQLPAEAFARPVDGLAPELTTPGTLLIPRRFVLAQLPQGIVRADWDLVASQFPPHLIATSHEDIKGRLPEGQLVLPIDEIVRQFPPEIFLPTGPGPDMRGIEVFPAPFQPIDAPDGARPARPPGAVPDATPPRASAAGAAARPEPESAGVPGVATTPPEAADRAADEAGEAAAWQDVASPAPDVEVGPPGCAPVPTVAGAGAPNGALADPEPGAAALEEIPPAVATGADGDMVPPDTAVDVPPSAPPICVPPVEEGLVPAARVSDEAAADIGAAAESEPAMSVPSIGQAAPLPARMDEETAAREARDGSDSPEAPGRVRPAEEMAIVGAGAVAEQTPWTPPPVPADAPTPEAAARQGSEAKALRELVALLPPLGPLEVDVRAVEGFRVFTATSPGLDGDLTATAAGLVLPILARGRAAWPVDQLTLRGPHAALVLTPLGPLAAGGPVLATAVPLGRGLALLELRCRQAAAEHAARSGVAAGGAESHEEHDEPDLLDVEPSTRVREIASLLGALGTVSASALRDAEADRALYLFLPAGADVRAMGALAYDLSRALRQAAEVGAVFRTAMLRSGARRMVIRVPAAPSGRSDIIVAAGETARPGLAYRQVEHAAVALGAL